MPKSKVTDWDVTAANNEDIGGIDIRGTAKPSNFDDAKREEMAQIAKVNAGTDPVADTWTFADPADLTKRARLDAGNVTAGQTRVITAPDYNLDLAKVPNAAASQSFSASEKGQILANIGAAWELIEVFTPASGTSAIERANLSAYRDIRGFGKLAPTTDDRSLILRTSTDNGSSYDSGASDYPQLNVVLATSNSYGGSTSASSAFFITLTGVGNGTNEYVDFSFTISDFNKAAVCEIKTDVTYLNASAAKFRSFSTGARAQTTARNAVQVMFAAWSTMQGGGYMVLMGRRG